MLAALASAGLLAGVLGGARPPPAALAGNRCRAGCCCRLRSSDGWIGGGAAGGVAGSVSGCAPALRCTAAGAGTWWLPQRIWELPSRRCSAGTASCARGSGCRAGLRWSLRWERCCRRRPARRPLQRRATEKRPQVAVKMSLYGLTPLIVALTCRSATVLRGALQRLWLSRPRCRHWPQLAFTSPVQAALRLCGRWTPPVTRPRMSPDIFRMKPLVAPRDCWSIRTCWASPWRPRSRLA